MRISIAKCSVVIPVNNGERFVREAIDSLLGQTHIPAEIIVIDDGSTDTSVEIVSRYPAPVKLISTSGAGASAARNRGIQEAAGEFVAFLDCDDIALPERLEKQLAILEANRSIGMVFCAMSYMDQSGHLTGDHIRCPEFNPQGFLGQLFERNRIGSTSTAMIRRSILEELGGFDENLAYNEEYDLWLRIAKNWQISYQNEPLLHYRLHDENVSRSREGQRRNEKKSLQKHAPGMIYQALQSTYPESTHAKLAFARVLFRMDHFDKALAVCNELLAGDFSDPRLSFLLGNIYLRQNHLEKAEAAYLNCLALDPADAAARNNLGVIYARTRRDEKAATAFVEAAALKRHYSDPVHNSDCLKCHTVDTMQCTWAPLRPVLKPER